MTADWFKSTTDVLADQLFALQLIRLRAAECNTSVTEILDSDTTCDGIFLALSELQDCRRQLVDRFDECPVKFQWNVLYCLCAIEVLVMEVFVDDKHLDRVKLVAETMKRAANTRDLDSLVTEKLLFDFFGVRMKICLQRSRRPCPLQASCVRNVAYPSDRSLHPFHVPSVDLTMPSRPRPKSLASPVRISLRPWHLCHQMQDTWSPTYPVIRTQRQTLARLAVFRRPTGSSTIWALLITWPML